MSHRLVSLTSGKASFEGPEGEVEIQANAIVLALGGGSWPQTGSDGAWVETLEKAGVKVHPLAPVNCGWEVDWSSELAEQLEAQPLKNVVASAGDQLAPGEIMLTRYGMEGGPLYALGPVLRTMKDPLLTLDFKPTFTIEKLVSKMESAKKNFLAESQYRWKLSGSMRLILDHFHVHLYLQSILHNILKHVVFHSPKHVRLKRQFPRLEEYHGKLSMINL
jgi:predicted flavoprotein YhiN